MDDRSGQILLGRYKLERPLGKGGMGSVWLASHLRTGRRVAVKLLEDRYLSNASIVKRFGREARAASAIEHPGIVEVLDLDRTDDGVPFIVMELLEGETLADYVKSHGPLTQQEALDVFVPLLDALEAAHERGIVHRDLKPDNIFLLPPGAGGKRPVKILDFGISQKADEVRSHLTQTGAVLGTPHYMSPEQALGESDLDARADVYAVAIVLYECVVGDVPYDAGNYNALLQAILRATPKRPRERGAKVSAAFEDVVLAGMEKDRDKRIPSARAFRERLVAAATGAALADPRGGAGRAGPATGAGTANAAEAAGAGAPGASAAPTTPAPAWGDFDFGPGGAPRKTPHPSQPPPAGYKTGASTPPPAASGASSSAGGLAAAAAVASAGAPHAVRAGAPAPSAASTVGAGHGAGARPGVSPPPGAPAPLGRAVAAPAGFPASMIGVGVAVRTFDDEATGPALELEDVPFAPRMSRASGTMPAGSAARDTPEGGRRESLTGLPAAASPRRASSSGALPAVDAASAGPVARARASSSGGFPAVSPTTGTRRVSSSALPAVAPDDAQQASGAALAGLPLPELGEPAGPADADAHAAGPAAHARAAAASTERADRVAGLPRAAWTAIAAILAFVAVVAAIRLVVRPGETAHVEAGAEAGGARGATEPAPPRAPDPPPRDPPAPPRGTVQIDVVGLPHNARMRLDGLPAATLPLRVRAGERHVLEVEAPGYETRRIEFTPESDLRLSADLRPAL